MNVYGNENKDNANAYIKAGAVLGLFFMFCTLFQLIIYGYTGSYVETYAKEENIPISIAKGFARYDSEKDTNFIDVFNKADDAMYENKRKIKGLK